MEFYEMLLLGSAITAGAGIAAWRTIFPWIRYDFQLMNVWRKFLNKRTEAKKMFLVDQLEIHAANQPKKPFIIFEDCVYTYEYVDQMANKVANLAKSWGLKALDVVAIMIQNEPAFIWTFLGLQKLGVSVAFINYNLRMHALTQSVLAAKPKLFIVGSGEALLEAVTEVRDDLGLLDVYVQGLGSDAAPHGIISYDPLFQESLSSAISPKLRGSVTMKDVSCFIYTSGTTGATVVLRRRFSASRFLGDCLRHDVTVIQYIGELFRFLLAQPPSKFDSSHKIRVAFGNGLRKDIWTDVKKRFKIPQMIEFFGATEGTSMLLNIAGRPGAIGRLSPLMNKFDPDPKALVQFDFVTAMPVRDKNGRCIRVGIGEPGLFISRVPADLIQNGEFEVYLSSKEANEKKLFRDAFVPGDIYVNYGDVLVLDKDYFLYFKDRIGDTFRWKGENVSTTELANVITHLNFINDANVYGVSVAGHDGRAGMVALTLNDGFSMGDKELKELYDHIAEELPSYAQPLFIRVLDRAIVNGTFKQRKVELVEEAYDLDKVKDPIYYLNREKKIYSPLFAPDLSRLLTSKL